MIAKFAVYAIPSIPCALRIMRNINLNFFNHSLLQALQMNIPYTATTLTRPY